MHQCNVSVFKLIRIKSSLSASESCFTIIVYLINVKLSYPFANVVCPSVCSMYKASYFQKISLFWNYFQKGTLKGTLN